MDAGLHHHTRDYSVGELIQLVNSGRVAVPDFQRDFVWEPGQVVELFDSVSHGWPIGSLLILQGPQPFGLKPIDDGPSLDPEDIDFYLLDGQQRVTALFHILTDAGDTVYFVKPGDVDEEGGQRIRWQRRDLFSRRRDRDQYITLSDLADSRRFEEATAALDSSAFVEMQNLRRSTLGALENGRYSLPAIVMSNDIDLEALTRIFETLNRTGVKLDAFDLMVAVMRRADFLLRQRWEEAVEENLRLKSMKVEGIELLKLIALWQRDADKDSSARPPSRRVQGVRQRDVLNVPANAVMNNWARAVAAYDRALAFLDVDAGVVDPDSMPSWAMVLPLAYFLDRGMPEPGVRRWYWNAIATQAYAQGANTQVITDVDSRGSAEYHRTLEVLESALNDSVKRNRILRLGLRGLARARGQVDILSGEPLGNSTLEISVPLAISGTLSTPRSEPLIDLGLTTAQSLAAARSELRKTQIVELDALGLHSQGFDFDLNPGSDAQKRRARSVVAWFKEWV